MHKTLCAAPAIVQLDQTEFRTSYAERERISVTGSPLPKRLQGGFLADCNPIRPRPPAISSANSFGVFLTKGLGRPALAGFTTPSLNDLLRLRQREKEHPWPWPD
jgi:hypothetical protein